MADTKEAILNRLEGPKPGERVYLRRVYIDRAEYKQIRFYMVFTISGSLARYISAPDRDAARRFVLKHYPHALFWR